MSYRNIIVVLVFLYGTLSPVTAQRPRPGMSAVQQLETLPLLYEPGTSTKQFSSYDPSGSNNDGNFTTAYTKYIDSNGEFVIFDATGPGCLYRQQYNIWYAKQFVDAGKTHIKYYFDDETAARIDVPINDFFGGKIQPFRNPFAFLDSAYRFGILYYPFSFQKRLKITTTYNLNELSRTDAPYDAAWYQYTYHQYAKNDAVRSWTKNDTAFDQRVIKQWTQLPEDPKPTAGNIKVSKTLRLPTGQHFTMAQIEGAGSITALKIQIEPYNRDVFYNTHLRIYWDGSQEAAVDLPLANFFGAGGETYKNCQDIFRKQLQTLMFGYDGNRHEFYCYWPMPFWRSATFELWNDSQTRIDSARLMVEYKPSSILQYSQAKAGYFYAKRTITKDVGEGIFSTVFKETGRGHVVGLSFYSNNYAMDGDEFTYIDGSHTPQIHGDGTEDDHNQGWGGDAYQTPVWGGVVNGYQGAYRLYLNDAYVFNKDITINYEYTREGGEDYGGEVDAVVYYYKSPLPSGLTLTDTIDVGNIQSEKIHSYVITGKTSRQLWLSGYDGYERNYEYDMVRDTGYAYTGYSEFQVAISPKNKGVRIRRRIYRAGNGVQRANVYVDGVKIDERPWDVVTEGAAPSYQGWYDADFDIPSSYTKGKSHIKIKIEYVDGEGSKQEINEFYYWVYSYSDTGNYVKSRPGPTARVQTKVQPTEKSIAKFLGTDTATRGSWAGRYQTDGFILLKYFFGRDCQALPEYISSVDPGDMHGIQFSSWNSSTASSLNASPINPTKRYLGALATTGRDSVTVYVKDNKKHHVAIYFCDFDKKMRMQDVEIIDLNGHLLSPKIGLNDFSQGKWLLYEFSGSFRVRLTNKANDAVISGLLFGKDFAP